MGLVFLLLIRFQGCAGFRRVQAIPSGQIRGQVVSKPTAAGPERPRLGGESEQPCVLVDCFFLLYDPAPEGAGTVVEAPCDPHAQAV